MENTPATLLHGPPRGGTTSPAEHKPPIHPPRQGSTRDYLGHRFVYCVISQRARGLSIGVNLNPDKDCNFDCLYCEVDRSSRGTQKLVDLKRLSQELIETLELATQGRLRTYPPYRSIPDDLLQLKEVALSGDGEPTLCPNFADVLETVVHVRAQGQFPFFKLVLITNGTGLDRPEVAKGLSFFTSRDEVWAKLDVGTQAAMDQVNRSTVPLSQVLNNILHLARSRPVIIQSLFPLLQGLEPTADEIEEYVHRLRELKEAGAQIPLVQVYSAHRPATHQDCAHLSLRSLSNIARRVREISGLAAEVF